MPRLCCASASMLAVAALASSELAVGANDAFPEKGDAVVVSVDGAPLQVGSDVRARLTRGEPLRVLDVRRDWIWTSIERNGREIKGWIHSGHLRPSPLRPNVVPPDPRPRRTDPTLLLNRLGAKLRLDDGGEITGVDFQGKRIPPAVLADLQQLESLKELNLSYCGGISDESLRAIGDLRALESLDLTFCGDIGDTGLEHLRGLTSLKRLNLSGTAVTDLGLSQLSGLAALEELDLSGSLIRRGAIDGSGLRHLTNLRKLQRLSLYNTFVDDAGLEPIQNLTRLESLDLGDTWVSPEGLARLQSLKRLQELRLAYCDGIDDSALETLAKLPHLERLDLTFCRITDAGAEHLASMKKLRRLVLSGTRLTDSAEARIAAALPDCKMER